MLESLVLQRTVVSMARNLPTKPFGGMNEMDPNDKPTLFRPAVGKRGMTQLQYDAYCGNLEGLLWCLENGADVNAVDEYRGYTALHWLADMAAAAGPRLEMLRALVRHGADIRKRTGNGTTALALARDAGSEMGDKLAAELVEMGADAE